MDGSGDAWVPTRASTASWVLYDLANTIFALGVGGLYFAAWLTDRDTPDLALAIAIDVAMVAVIFLGPWLGAVSDHHGRRRRYLVPTTLLAVVPTYFLASVGVTASLVLFSVALVGFNLGGVVYDALLPDVSTAENRGRVSGIGVGVGYLGSFIALGVGALLLDPFGEPAVFAAIATLFLLFALPTFLFVRERPRPGPRGPAPAARDSLRRLAVAWRETRRHRGVTRFLVARFFYTDGINTLIGGFLTIYVIEELDFSDAAVQALLGIAIAGAMVGGLAGGRLVDRVGPRRLLHLALETWVVAIAIGVVAVLADAPWLVWGLGVAGGLALGATWTSDRVYMARISPPERLGEFYGLYATVGRFATILGPLTWGLIVTVAGLSRTVAMAVLAGFILTGRVLLQPVDDRVRDFAAAEGS